MEESGKRSINGGLVVLGVALAVGMVLSSWLVSDTVKSVKLANQTIAVKGTAQVDVRSDIALWAGRFTARDADLVKAYSKLESDLEKVLGFLGRSGIPREEIEVSAVTTMIQYHPDLDVDVAFPPLERIDDTLADVISAAGAGPIPVRDRGWRSVR